MKFSGTFKSSWAGVVTGVALSVLLGAVLYEFTFGSGLVKLSYDLLLVARPNIPVQEAVVIYMDEKSHQNLGQPLNAPWDRSIHAQLVDRLTAAEARAVVFDIVFSDSGPPAADARLADAIRKNGRVVLAADFVRADEKQKEFIPPFPGLSTNAADIGSAELDPDRDMITRRHPPNDEVLTSLSWTAARLLQAGATRKPGAELLPRWINYYGPANTTPHCSYWEALDVARVPDDFFRGKIVFVGARLLTKFSGDRKDEFRTPHTFWIDEREHRFIAGVEIQAIACLNLLRGDWLTRWPPAVERSLVLVLGALFGAGLLRLRPFAATGVALAAIAAVAFGSYELFVRKLVWFPWLILAVQLGVALLWAIVFNSIRLYVENRLYVQSLELYLSPKLVKKFSRDKTLLLPGAQKQTLTILFSDIANFTSLSEGMDSDDLARLMNQYFQSAVAQCIHATDGTVVKYIGDAIFAFWNAPDPQPDHAARACAAALRFRDQPATALRGTELVTRLGLHTGVANVGNFGSTHRIDYTAIGESINLASRMEGLNKYLGTQILLTGETQALVADRFVTRALGRFRLKGFEKSVEVFELLGQSNQAEASRPLRESFATALQKFQERDFPAAEAAFQRVLELSPNDGPSKFCLKECARLCAKPPPAIWSGEIELEEK